MSPTSRRRQEQRTRELLDESGPPGAIECGRDAHASYEEQVGAHLAELRAAGGIACSAGCSACCSLEVAATFPEMARLAQFVEASFSIAARAALSTRLEARAGDIEGMTGQQRSSGSRACVLLVDDRCSAYEARPLACRGWTSADSAPCFVALELPASPPSIPVNAHLRTTALDVARGISDGVREQGLDDGPLDLASSLRALLDDGAAWSERWLAGEMLPVSMKSPSVPRRHQGEDGRWRFREELVKPVPGPDGPPAAE